MRARQFIPKQSGADLVIFDIDDTLLHTTAKIKVVKAGQAVKELTNQEFNHYDLQPGEEFDFGEFRNAEKFNQESKPIKPMIAKLKTIIKQAGNAKVIMLTARADFDNKDLFLDTFAKHGIDMSNIHVHRAGNLPGNDIPAQKKAIWVRKYLNTGKYAHVRLYDDSMSNLQVFKELQTEYPTVDFRAIYVGPGGTTQAVEEDCWKGYKQIGMKKKGKKTVPNCVPANENQDTDTVYNYGKLDKILSKLCDMIIAGQDSNKDYGKVAAAVLDPSNQIVARLNRPGKDGKRVHAEHAAMKDYMDKYGAIPEGSIVITTLSPCDKHMDERDGPSCTNIINSSSIEKVYCGYTDPTQGDDTKQFNLVETADEELRQRCKQFADTFLDNVEENNDAQHLEERRKKKRKVRRAAYGPGPFGGYGYYSGYSGDGGADGGGGESMKNENFADGKNPQDKGDSKRHGINTKASVSSLRKTAKQGGRKGQLAHWLANMKAGKKK